MARYCLPDTTPTELAKILQSPDDETFLGDYLAEQIGIRLGLPAEFFSTGFNYLREENLTSVELFDVDSRSLKHN